jgi:hypothetical protein
LAISLVTVPSLLWYQAGNLNVVSRGGDIGVITPPSQRLGKVAARSEEWDDGYNEQGNCSRAYRAGAVPKTPPDRRLALLHPTVRMLGVGFGTTSTRSVFSIMCQAGSPQTLKTS